MKNEINIAIFGMNLSLLDELKNKIRLMLPENIQINWTNIAEPNLDCIMINDVFFTSANIQNLIHNKKLNYLRLVKDPSKGGLIEGDILYVPLENTSHLNQWIGQYILGNEVRVKPALSSLAPESVTQNQTHTTAPIVNSVSSRSSVSEKILADIFNDRNGNIQLFDSSGNLAIINAKSEQVWVNGSRAALKTDGSFNYTYVTAQNLNTVKDVFGIDLRLWMFNLAWHSNHALNLPVSHQKFYKLIYWPQAESGSDRRDIIRLSAAFAKGASIKQVSDFTKIDTSTIEKFISTCLVARLIHEVPSEQAKLVKFTAPAVEQATPQQAEKANAVTSFFGRLRKRLGF